MNPTYRFMSGRGRRAVIAALAIIGVALALSAGADQMLHPKPHAGGLRIQPEMTSVSTTSSNATVSWYGLLGNYSLQTCPAVSGGTWISVGALKATNYTATLTAPVSGDAGFF